MPSHDKTLVLITIDAEPSEKYENGCFSYCVNGRWQDRLDEWCAADIAVRTPRGYKFTESAKQGLIAFQGGEKSEGPLLTEAEVASRIANAEAGLPSIYKITGKHGAPCVTFLDVAQLYIYGEKDFQEASDLTNLSGNDLQLHLHPSVLPKAWYEERGHSRPDRGEVQDWPKDVLEAVHRIATDDMTQFAPKRPTAYRAGAYRISDTLIDVLVELGYEFDFSYDLLNKKGNVRFDPSLLNGNAPIRYRGLIEIPITAFAYRSPEKVKRFVGNPKPFSRIEALKQYRKAGLRVITYILHSYSLMQVYDDPKNGVLKAGRLGLDPLAVENFDAELAYMKDSGEFEFVDIAGLKSRIEEDPTILEGPAPFATVR